MSEALFLLGNCCCVGKSTPRNVCADGVSGEHSFTSARLSMYACVSTQTHLREPEMFSYMVVVLLHCGVLLLEDTLLLKNVLLSALLLLPHPLMFT